MTRSASGVSTRSNLGARNCVLGRCVLMFSNDPKLWSWPKYRPAGSLTRWLESAPMSSASSEATSCGSCSAPSAHAHFPFKGSHTPVALAGGLAQRGRASGAGAREDWRGAGAHTPTHFMIVQPSSGPRSRQGGPHDSHLHLRPPRTQAHSHRITNRCVTITDTREYCSMCSAYRHSSHLARDLARPASYQSRLVGRLDASESGGSPSR